MNCVICTEELITDIRYLECHHSFHTKCILSWFGTNRKDCPICRDGMEKEKDINDEDLKSIDIDAEAYKKYSDETKEVVKSIICTSKNRKILEEIENGIKIILLNVEVILKRSINTTKNGSPIYYLEFTDDKYKYRYVYSKERKRIYGVEMILDNTKKISAVRIRCKVNSVLSIQGYNIAKKQTENYPLSYFSEICSFVIVETNYIILNEISYICSIHTYKVCGKKLQEYYHLDENDKKLLANEGIEIGNYEDVINIIRDPLIY